MFGQMLKSKMISCYARLWIPRQIYVTLHAEVCDKSVLHQILDSSYPCYTELWIQAGANVDLCYTKFRAER